MLWRFGMKENLSQIKVIKCKDYNEKMNKKMNKKMNHVVFNRISKWR